jgi:SAM-dependent methyltransferase
MNCRHCSAVLEKTFLDLGHAPPSNAYLSQASLAAPEVWYPLKVMVCTECWLVQTLDYTHSANLFSADYAYFSSFSSSWLRHAESYVDAIVNRFGMNGDSKLIEIACNDGYLLQYVQERGIPCLGIEPTASTAEAARKKGISVVQEFFGKALAERLIDDHQAADLVTANNVLAHVPDINDFVAGVATLLKPHGVVTFEFPHLLRLVGEVQFDTVYHEHFSYLSLTVAKRICEHNGLAVFDVEELPTHGGSLRVFAQRRDHGIHPISVTVGAMLASEQAAGMSATGFYSGFQNVVDAVRNEFVDFLVDARKHRRVVAAYGAAAKGNTLMNYAGVRSDLIQFVVDRNPSKQGKYMPGSHLPIVDESRLRASKPDYIVLFPWNLKEELALQLEFVRSWGGALVTAIPKLSVWGNAR